MIRIFSPEDQIEVYLAEDSRNPTRETAIDRMAIDS
jgi:hypothetical protein